MADLEKIKEAGRKFGLTEPAVTSGMIVKFKDPQNRDEQGHYRVRKVTKNTVNLGAIFGKGLYHKSIQKSRVVEDEATWYAAWQQSETYQCM